jgi:hypothetical protein
LVDWTRHPFIAAYFAAEDVILNSYPDDSFLVLWAFYFPVLGKHYAINKQDDPIRVVTAPSATNSNLKAQQGVFTLTHYLNDREDNGTYRPFEIMFNTLVEKADPQRSSSDQLIVACKLQKFLLPISEANELLYLLAKLDITPSAVYPGFRSILRDIQMRSSWESSGVRR